ncbi:MAG: CusA/CzcA family heavy metal efflux RND transporter [Opitutus sp.]
MIDRILEFSVRQRAIVFLGAVLLLGVGLWSAFQLPVDAVPDITGVQVQINTEVPALAAEESEKLVTQMIEVELAGLAGVQEMRSLTKFGLSQVTLQFNDGTDIYRARQLITERLQGIASQLPAGTAPKLAPISTGLGEIFYYSVSYGADAVHKPATERDQLIALSEIHEYLIKPLLRSVPGIAEINAVGGFEKQYFIQPKPEALAAVGLTFSELADLITLNMENAGGGIIQRGGEQFTIRAVSRVTNPTEISELPLKLEGRATPLLVRDVADVVVGTKFRTGAATLNGREVVIGTTMMLTGENGRDVAHRVKERLGEIQRKLPPGVLIQPEYDRSELVGRTIRTVETNLFEGAVLVAVVLLLLLGNVRAALIVTCTIPLAFLFALTGMARFGISGNLMSLGAVDFGLVIDGAVVVVENVLRRLADRQRELGRIVSARERAHVVLAACKQVGRPMFFGVLIITVVYLPLLGLTGTEGKMFHPMALTVMLALGGALVLTLTLVPALSVWLLRGKVDEEDNRVMRLAKRLYEPVLKLALRWRVLVVSASALLFAGSLWLFTHLGAEFVPTLDEGSVTAMLYKPVGMSIEQSVRTDITVEQRLLADFPEVTRVFSRIGTSEVATDPMPVNESDVYITYKPLSEWPRTAGRPTTKAELVEQLAAAIKQVNPEYSTLFAQPIEMRFNEMLEGTKAELAVKIFGQDYAVLEPLAEQIKVIIEQTPGVAEVEYEAEGRTPQLELTVKRDVVRRSNLQSAEINQAVTTALAGQEVGQLIEGNRRVDVVVRMAEELRSDEAQIKRLPLRVGEHGILPLGDVVEFSTVRTVEPIRRDAGQRRAALMVNLNTRDIERFVRAVDARVRAEVKLPDGYLVEFGGQFKNLQEARARFTVVVPAALGLIFVLIVLAFGSFRQALLVYSGIPLAVTGGVVALWVRGMPFSITAAVGFIALTGVAVLNGVVLVSYFNELRDAGRSVRDAVIEGAMTRLRPVMMTAAVASFGFVPMAFATGAGAEVQRPLATVVIGGIVSSTFLTLLLLPVLYGWVQKDRRRGIESEATTDFAAEERALSDI